MLVLAGCNNTTGGSGSPDTSSNGGSSQSSSPSSDNNASGGTASLKPCDLLSSSVISQNNLTPNGSGNEAGARTCNYRHAIGADESPGYSIKIAIRDKQGLKDINTDGYTVTSDNLGGHSARQLEQNPGTACFVAIGVTSSSRVDVLAASTSGDAGTSCQIANQYAKLIEPNLPGGS